MYEPNPEEEKRIINNLYRKLFKVWKPRKPEDRESVKKAYKIAFEAHKGMRRKTGEPYISHPLHVALIAVEEIGLGVTSIVCALLHDVVEDTEYTLDDIRGMFGDKVASIISGLTKIKGIFDKHSSTINAENFKKILLTLSDDVRVILIKLADRLHNMRTLDALPRDKQLKIASETRLLYAPLAHRLGLHTIKSELEDLALKFTQPDVYQSISSRIRETSFERQKFVNRFLEPIKKKLKEKGFIYDITAREKSIAAIWHKMQAKEVKLEEVYDIFAVRIVIDSPVDTEKADCWKVYSLITETYTPNMSRLRDWISIPKANGYEALHTTVMSKSGKWVEIQIRSKRMDEIAEKGYAAHWKYKESLNMNSRLDNWLDRIREMIVSPDADALSFIDDVKGYFFLEEISVFTPQGELRTLPAGSTVLDFAYAIHSELGHTCIGAKVDKNLVPVNHVLENGQQVEILTSRTQRVTEDWLSHVMTTRAKTNIKLKLKTEQKKLARIGKERLGKFFLQAEITPTHDSFRKFASFLGYRMLDELYLDVTYEKFGLKEVQAFREIRDQRGRNKRIRKRKATQLMQDKSDRVLNVTEKKEEGPESTAPEKRYTVAECCSPIPGDEVIGLLHEETDSITIHRSKCLFAQELISLHQQNMILLEWPVLEQVAFYTEISISGIDRKGLINEITRVISNELDLNIKSFHIEASEGLTRGIIALYVSHTSTLYDVQNKLAVIDGIAHVTRIEKK